MTTVTRDYHLSESGINSCSDSDGEQYHSLETSPQEDKVFKVGAVTAQQFLDKHCSSYPINSGMKLKTVLTGEINPNTEFQTAQSQNNFDYGLPSAPPMPLDGSFPTPTDAAAKPSLPTAAGGSSRTAAAAASVSSNPAHARYPTFHASGLGHWYGVISYEACVRLCLHSWARDENKEAKTFLANECALLRDAFGLRNVLLQSEDELLTKQSSEIVGVGAFVKAKKTIGKCGSVAETIAYNCVLETAMKIEQFQQRKLNLNGDWKWLVKEFASYYGVSDAYTKLRYLSYVMDVATPTADCLDVVRELLQPVVSKTNDSLSHQEIRMLGEVSGQIEHILSLVFENYKSLDEFLSSEMMDAFGTETGVVAPALAPAWEVYKLLHDIFSPEAQFKLYRYFQNAIKKRSRRHLLDTDEYASNNTENVLMDALAFSTAYEKVISLCLNIQKEILTDIEIQKLHILPSFIDLPNLSSAIYSTELFSRLRTFLISCPPVGPTPPVVALVKATADFERDLALWNIGHIKGGVDAKELFHMYITRWIRDKRLALLEFCKFDKVKPPILPTQHSTTCFIDDIYGRLNEMLAEYDVIISLWPEYSFTLEKAIADVEKAVVESLEKLYAEVSSLPKENTIPMKHGFKYVQKLAKGGRNCPYNVTTELGVLLNSMKRMLDTLRPKIEAHSKLWGSCMPESFKMTVMIRMRFRAYVQAVTEKLVENTKLHDSTKLKKIIQNEHFVESDFRPLKELLSSTIDQLHGIFDTKVFVIVCRDFWDRMGQDVLDYLEDRKENRVWYKSSRVAVNVLDDTFASQMQQLLGNALQKEDLDPPRCMKEIRSMLW